MSKDATYKVTYFPGKGGGEILRLVLSAKGLKFEDVRLPREEWMKVKAADGPGCPPTKQLPSLTVNENGKETVLAQSGACARFLAMKFGFFGSSPEEMVIVDEAYETAMDVQRELFKIVFQQDQGEKAKLTEEFKTVSLKRLEDYVKNRSDTYGQDGYLVGKSTTLADLQLYNVIDQTIDRLGADVFAPYPELKKHMEKVKSDPKIAKWTKEMPPPQF
uniref:Sigma glutathione S-transferase 2 n=1 Tax=Ruditapes philippinarum TaxID=129788 RepID=G9HSP3_RUDPH|nr:sigma glutathione S-transferase 2 [Ruditapes philippinarum]